MLNVGAGETIHKEVLYITPAFLSGTYKVGVEARNQNGLLFALSGISQEVVFKGAGGYIEVSPDKCFLTVSGEVQDKKYNLTQGVDISSEETLITHCTIKNNFKTTQSVVPTFLTHYRSIFGKVVGEAKKQNPVTLSPGEEISFSAPLPKVSEPQAYDAIMTFVNSNNETLSLSVDFHYVLRGAGATIQNMMLDKDYYAKGDTANISFLWTGAANAFPGAREQATKVDATNAVFVILNGKNELCASEYVQKLTENTSRGSEQVSIPITSACKDPVTTVKVVDSAGKSLAQGSYALTSKNPPTEKNVLPIAFAIILFLVVACLSAFVIRKRNVVAPLILFLMFVAAGTLVGGKEARADTFTGGYLDHTVSLNKAAYAPGETITVTANGIGPDCGNSGGGDSLYAGIEGIGASVLLYSAGPDGSYTQVIASGGANFTAPATGGTYNMLFQVTNTWAGSYVWEYRIQFTVTSPIPTTTFSASPLTIPYNTAAILTWSSTDATGCTAGNAWSGAKGISGSESTGNLIASQTYALYCSGPGGNSTTQSVTVTVNPPANTSTAPTITGPTTLITGTNGTYSFTATDPQGDQVRYGIDWDMNGSADTWLPAGVAYINSGTAQSITHNWATTGLKTFQALTQDFPGLNSAWTLYNVTVSTPPVCTTSNPSVLWNPCATTPSQCAGLPSPRDVAGTKSGTCSDGSTGTVFQACTVYGQVCTIAPVCPNAICESSLGENPLNCPKDCKVKYKTF